VSEEFEERLLATRTEAYAAFSKAVEDRRPLPQIFAIGAEAYEAELRLTASTTEAADRDFAEDMRALDRVRANAQQMNDAATVGTPEHFGLQMILADLDKVLGPDLVREADPSGEVLKSLPYDERKRMLAAFDREDTGQAIIVMVDECGPLLERARQMHQEPLEVGSPEHDAFCMDETAKMAAEDVARGEGE
jgi:hypothetical protein